MKKFFIIFITLFLTIVFAQEVQKNIDFGNWRQGGTVITSSSDCLKIIFKKNSGRYLQARKGISGNLKDFNCLTFKIKSSSDLTGLNLIFWANGQRAIADSSLYVGDKVLPKNQWITCFWQFRKNPGWVTPKRKENFDFDNITALAFNCDSQKLLADETTIEVKDIRFIKLASNTNIARNIYSAGWKKEGATYQRNNDILKITYSKKQGKYPQVRKFFSNGLKGYNRFSCELKFSVPMPGLAFILQQGKYRAIASAINIAQIREFPPNQWVKVQWDFRKSPGWITPPRSKVFDFDNASSIAFNCTTSSLPIGEHTMEVKNMNFEYFDESVTPLSLAKKAFASKVSAGSSKGKKIVVWPNHGVKNGNTLETFVKDIALYHALPIDGVNLDMEVAPFRDSFFSPKAIDESTFIKVKKIVKNTQWKNLKNNFFRIDIASSWGKNPDNTRRHFDWFDDNAWKIILNKITQFAEVCKECNFNIMFDTEAYTTEPYDYYKYYRNTNKTFAEYQKQVRIRGKQVADAFAKGHPNAVILMMFASWVVKIAPDQDRYGLLPAFIDGMCDSQNKLTIIDGYEGGYEFTDETSVKNGLYSIKVIGPSKSQNPKRYKEVIKSGFGVWLRHKVFSPEQFNSIIEDTLKFSDRYVWVYLQDNPITKPEVKACFDAVKRK